MEVRVILVEGLEGKEGPGKLGNFLAVFWHFVTDIQLVFHLFFNNINSLSSK